MDADSRPQITRSLRSRHFVIFSLLLDYPHATPHVCRVNHAAFTSQAAIFGCFHGPSGAMARWLVSLGLMFYHDDDDHVFFVFFFVFFGVFVFSGCGGLGSGAGLLLGARPAIVPVSAAGARQKLGPGARGCCPVLRGRARSFHTGGGERERERE